MAGSTLVLSGQQEDAIMSRASGTELEASVRVVTISSTAGVIVLSSKDSEDSEKFKQENKLQQEVLMLWVGNAMLKVYQRKNISSQAARYVTIHACGPECFQYLIQLLKSKIYD